jgi:hypothetical protein
MPVARIINERKKTQPEDLLEILLHEWRAQQEGTGEPLIIEESPLRGELPNHLYVVWSRWGDLTPLERSRLILQAYERYKGREITSRVTLAMGLTPDEAEKIGISTS